MKKLIERYVRKQIWRYGNGKIHTIYSDLENQVTWVMQGYPFHWHTRLWAATHCGYHDYEKVYKFLVKQ